MTLTINDESFVSYGMLTAMLLFKAMVLYVDRSEREVTSASAATL